MSLRKTFQYCSALVRVIKETIIHLMDHSCDKNREIVYTGRRKIVIVVERPTSQRKKLLGKKASCVFIIISAL